MLTDPSQIRVSGPLSAFAAGFAEELAQQGYRPRVAGSHMRLLAQLSRWLEGEGLGADGLYSTEVERFLLVSRAAGYAPSLDQSDAAHTRLPTRSRSGTNTAATNTQRSGRCGAGAIPKLPDVERGLGAKTARGYVDAVRLFLHGRILPDGLALDLGQLTAADVVSFVVPVRAIVLGSKR